MFISVGNLLSPLYPLLSLLQGLMFRDTDEDEPDEGDQPSDKGKADELIEDDDTDTGDDDPEDDDDDDSDEEDDDTDDDLQEDIDDQELTARNADTAISRKDAQVVSSLMSLVKTMVKYPDTAEDTIKDLQSEQPELASRLAKMYESEKNDSMKAALKDAPEELRSLLSKLVDDVGSIQKKSEQDQIAEDKRVYKEWEKSAHPYLNPKSESSQTKVGKKLRQEFANAINRFPANEPITEDLLEDALVIAKRRSGWNNSKVSDTAKQQAKEQAQKARSGAAGAGKSKTSGKGEKVSAPSRITGLFPNQSEDRQKKVDEIKAKKFKS